MTDTNPRYLLTEHEALLARLSDVLWNNGLNNAAREVDAAVERLHNFLAQPEPEPDDPDYYLAWLLFACDGKLRPEAQRVLAAYGIAQPEPVPMSERLPKAEDCDAQGNCWLTNSSTEPGWVLDNPEKCTNWTHWVPHWAMPVVTK